MILVHTAASATQFPIKKLVPVVSHFPFSPNLNPPDYFYFPKLNMKLKGNYFATIEEIL